MPSQRLRRRRLKGLKEPGQGLVGNHDRGNRNGDSPYAHLDQFRNRHQFRFHTGNGIHQIHRQRFVDLIHSLLNISLGPNAINEQMYRSQICRMRTMGDRYTSPFPLSAGLNSASAAFTGLEVMAPNNAASTLSNNSTVRSGKRDCLPFSRIPIQYRR